MIKVIIMAVILIPVIHLYSFTKYTWKDNKLSSLGSAIIGAVALLLPAVLLLRR